MPVAPADWITFAQTLVADSEIANRSAASRAYYGAFHLALPIADRLPAPANSKGGMHDRAIRAMCEYMGTAANRDKATAIRKVGTVLNACRSLRSKADYDCDLDFAPSEAQEAIGFAKAAIAMLQTIKFP
jgi:uncharacterized protein (UPF0332 family)